MSHISLPIVSDGFLELLLISLSLTLCGREHCKYPASDQRAYVQVLNKYNPLYKYSVFISRSWSLGPRLLELESRYTIQ